MATSNNNPDSGQAGHPAALVPTSATLLLTPLPAAVPAEGGALEVLVRVQAPQRPPQPGGQAHQRMPLRLALVVDRSGSMSGEPLQEALRCVQHIGSLLQPDDQLAVVLYDDHVQVPMPLARAPGAQAVQTALAGVDSGGSTDLHAGWETGARELVAGTAGAISRVVLLSDGQANHGLTDTTAIASECAQWLQRGVSTTTGISRRVRDWYTVYCPSLILSARAQTRARSSPAATRARTGMRSRPTWISVSGCAIRL